jgi:hypothetical protein
MTEIKAEKPVPGVCYICQHAFKSGDIVIREFINVIDEPETRIYEIHKDGCVILWDRIILLFKELNISIAEHLILGERHLTSYTFR